MNWRALLERAPATLTPGLTSDEIELAERTHAIAFPPDLAEMLREVLPTGKGWPDWRHPDDEAIANAMSWPLEGILFDIENNQFWLEEWGPRPAAIEEAFDIARRRVAEGPRLIPVYMHRYIPMRPAERGNPVFSVHQTDIIVYGRNLADYLENEFARRGSELETASVKKIELWSAIVDAINS